MPSLLLVIFGLQLVLHLINSLGGNAVNEVAWICYNKLPTPTAKTVQKGNRLRRDILRLKQELNSISGQDEYAKWTKLRRQHDKAVAEYQKCSSSVSSAKGQFSTVVGSLRWVLINGLRLGLMFWYTKVPMFWIPRGWLPGTIEWVMAFPKAPTGGVSIQVWSLACASVISFVAEALTAVYALWIESVPAGKDRQTHTPYSGAAQPSTDQRASEKKSS